MPGDYEKCELKQIFALQLIRCFHFSISRGTGEQQPRWPTGHAAGCPARLLSTQSHCLIKCRYLNSNRNVGNPSRTGAFVLPHVTGSIDTPGSIHPQPRWVHAPSSVQAMQSRLEAVSCRMHSFSFQVVMHSSASYVFCGSLTCSH